MFNIKGKNLHIVTFNSFNNYTNLLVSEQLTVSVGSSNKHKIQSIILFKARILSID